MVIAGSSDDDLVGAVGGGVPPRVTKDAAK